MTPRLAAAAIAVFLAFPVLPALAATGECAFQGVSNNVLTGSDDTVTGVLSASGGDLQATVECWVEVDGSTVANTVRSDGGTQTAQVTFTAGQASIVMLCGSISTPNGSGGGCVEMTVTQVPPQVVEDLLQQLLTIPDFLICPVLGSLAPGVPGIVDIDPYGDLAVVGQPAHDCPPYTGTSSLPHVRYWEAHLTVSD